MIKYLIFTMIKYTEMDIKVLDDAHDCIRRRPSMYMDTSKNYLEQILDFFESQMNESYGLENVLIVRSPNLVLAHTFPDWLTKSAYKIEEVFERICANPNYLPVNGMQFEVLLPAFHYSYYTYGELGSIGDRSLLDSARDIFTEKQLSSVGRVLLIDPVPTNKIGS